MDTLKKFLVLVTLAFLALPAVAFASDEPRFEVRDGEFRLEVEGDEFEVRGMVAAVGGDTFTVDGTTVTVDEGMVEEFEQEGILEEGADVRAEGIVVDGIFFAEDVKVDEVAAEDVEEEEEM